MIRLATPADAASCVRIYRPAIENSIVSFETLLPTEHEMAQRIASTLQQAPWLVLEHDEVVGYTYASRHRARAAYAWSVDLSVCVDASVHCRGVGTRLYNALMQLLPVLAMSEVAQRADWQQVLATA